MTFNLLTFVTSLVCGFVTLLVCRSVTLLACGFVTSSVGGFVTTSVDNDLQAMKSGVSPSNVVQLMSQSAERKN
jgi:hypothetical protein